MCWNRSQKCDIIKSKLKKNTESGTEDMDGKWKIRVIKSLKIALAALAAIAVAGELGLKYSATAGIITVLSIQNTKRETLKSARNRAMAFVCALVLSAGCFLILDYTLWAFAVYLLLFAFICLCMGWGEAIAMDSVLVTHFLTEGNMGYQMLLNETVLFCIGTVLGILVNLHLRAKGEEFDRLAKDTDDRIKGILHRMVTWILKEDKSEYTPDCFEGLQKSLKEAKLCAAANYGNALFRSDTGELDYIRMREQQSMILREIYLNIKRLDYLPDQAEQVAELLDRIEQCYHKDNTVKELLEELEQLLQQMREQPLPRTREEFEARAILFYILKQLQNLLELKRQYVLSRSAARGL